LPDVSPVYRPRKPQESQYYQGVEDNFETLEQLIVNLYKRAKYGAPDGNSDTGIITSPMPDHPIYRCKADIGLISYIIMSKFCDHLPLYRQDGIFEREGVDIPRATQTSWLMQVYEAVHPLENVLRQAVLESDVIFTDDSILPILVKGNYGKNKYSLSDVVLFYDGYFIDRLACSGRPAG